MTKTRIDPADIRKGDLIRAEYEGRSALVPAAVEYVAESDTHAYWIGRVASRSYFLLNRSPKTPHLPTEPTLGWIKFRDGDRWLGIFEAGKGRPGTFSASIDRGYTSDSWVAAAVDTFTPATAVPTEALEEMRRSFTDTSRTMTQQIAAGDKFLRAVEANA